jgi:hypothetical protein
VAGLALSGSLAGCRDCLDSLVVQTHTKLSTKVGQFWQKTYPNWYFLGCEYQNMSYSIDEMVVDLPPSPGLDPQSVRFAPAGLKAAEVSSACVWAALRGMGDGGEASSTFSVIRSHAHVCASPERSGQGCLRGSAVAARRRSNLKFGMDAAGVGRADATVSVRRGRSAHRDLLLESRRASHGVHPDFRVHADEVVRGFHPVRRRFGGAL